MVRVIKPSPKPFMVLGSVFGILLGLLIACAIAAPISQSIEMVKSIYFILFLLLIISVDIWRRRIVINHNSIILQQIMGSFYEIKFKDITGSIVEISDENCDTRILNIYVKGKQWPALSLLLKPYRERDVTWLLKLPELKVNIK